MPSPMEEVLAALKGLLAYVDQNTCVHEETHRSGTIWTICAGCGAKWADDEGGFKPHVDAPEVATARALLTTHIRKDIGSGGVEVPDFLKRQTGELPPAPMPKWGDSEGREGRREGAEEDPSPAQPSPGLEEDRQEFERYPKLAAWIEKLANRRIEGFSHASWCIFLAELNAALRSKPVSEAQSLPGWRMAPETLDHRNVEHNRMCLAGQDALKANGVVQYADYGTLRAIWSAMLSASPPTAVGTGWRPISDYVTEFGGVLLFFPEVRRGRTLLGEMYQTGSPGEYPHRPPSHFQALPLPPKGEGL